MKRVKSRATAALILAAMLLVGMVVYVIRLADNGGAWVMFHANQTIYSDGVLSVGTLTDRKGVVLAHAGEDAFYYADDAAVRTACLHAVGDFAGNIGTGALTAFADRLAGYSLVNGVSPQGATVELSIDADLNVCAYNAMYGRRGAVMLMDYTTGEVLCMLSTPGYDPNVGFDPSNSAYDGAYINRCISSAFVPGSVYKLVTLAAALENLDGLDSRTFTCTGSVQVGADTVTCTGYHGTQTLEQALANSCNCAFAQLSLELGADTLADYSRKLGFTESHTLNGVETRAGNFEKAAADTSDLAWSGIGQYTDLVCPYSMLRYVAAIANGGVLKTPTLIRGEGGGSEKLLAPTTAQSIHSMMSYNVSAGYGTWNFPGLQLCAKSGTAERGDGTSNAWFTGFLDDPDHPYAFVVVIEGGGGGLANAGALANTVLQAAVAAN